MTSDLELADLVVDAAARTPDATAIVGPDRTLTYAELDALSNQFALALRERGVSTGDRVGLWIDKSAVAVAAMQGTLRIGAAYVPLDPLAPLARIREIVADCEMRVVITTPGRAEASGDLPAAVMRVDPEATPVLDGPGLAPAERIRRSDDDLAYILYTSGSTGTPKGVCISHRNALAFIEWAGDEVEVMGSDRLSNHAPFHFDLSVFDLYAAFRAGASVHLVPETLAYAPERLVAFLVAHEISVWYSVPSALMLMMSQGGLLDVDPFPVASRHLRRRTVPDRAPPAPRRRSPHRAVLELLRTDRDERLHVPRGARHPARADHPGADRPSVFWRHGLGGEGRRLPRRRGGDRGAPRLRADGPHRLLGEAPRMGRARTPRAIWSSSRTTAAGPTSVAATTW